MNFFKFESDDSQVIEMERASLDELNARDENAGKVRVTVDLGSLGSRR